MTKKTNLIAIVFSILAARGLSQNIDGQAKAERLQVDAPNIILAGVPFDLTLTANLASGKIDTTYSGTPDVQGLFIRLQKQEKRLTKTPAFVKGKCQLKHVLINESGRKAISFSDGTLTVRTTLRIIPGVLSLLPPILAIVLALLARQVLLSLFCGIWLGATFVWNFNPLLGFLRALDTYLIQSLADSSHTSIVMFSAILGGMVGVVSKAGGMQGIVNKISRHANNPRGGQLATWAMGVFIFFDDYANTLVVGNTMRSFTDKLRMSREKLSYIVDSTAAPVASIAFISTWVGFQVGLIDSAFTGLGLERDAYLAFLKSIPFSSYSILTIFFVFLIGLTLRDFGTMYRAEHRASSTGKVLRDGAQPLSDTAALDAQPPEHAPRRWYNAMIPILTVITVVIVGLYYSGRTELAAAAATARFGEIIGAADSFKVLMWASFTGSVIAVLLAVVQRILSLEQAIQAWLGGVKAMVVAMIILVLAWAIGKVCEDLKTADYVINLSSGILSFHLIPLVTFALAAFIGFSTGTSWATMAILTPIVVTIAYKLPIEQGLDPKTCETILMATIGAVLSGSVFGDHCSPISDTTIMSSMASAADHIDHVRTQLPYAVIVALVACVIGYLPAGYGISPLLSIIIGVGLLAVVLFMVGKRIDRNDNNL